MKRKAKVYKSAPKADHACGFTQGKRAIPSSARIAIKRSAARTYSAFTRSWAKKRWQRWEEYVKRLCSKTKQSFLQNNITNIQLYIQYIYKYAWQIIAVIRQPKSAMSDRILILYIYISTKTYTDMRCWAGSGLARPFITLAIHTWSYVHNVSKPCKSRNNLNQP